MVEQVEKRKTERVNESDECTVIKLLFNRNIETYNFPFNRKDWYEALKYERVTKQ